MLRLVGNGTRIAIGRRWRTSPNHSLLERKTKLMSAIIAVPLLAAAGYSLVYLLLGGGVVGALVIFVVAKMLGK